MKNTVVSVFILHFIFYKRFYTFTKYFPFQISAFYEPGSLKYCTDNLTSNYTFPPINKSMFSTV